MVHTFCTMVKKNAHLNMDGDLYWMDTITLTYKFFISHFQYEFANKTKKTKQLAPYIYPHTNTDPRVQAQYEEIKLKYIFLNQALTNIFLNADQKEKILNVFSQTQKTYFAFARLAHVYKFKKSKIIVNHDLTLNPLDISSKQCFCLFQNNNRYLFHVNDLINLSNTSLSNSPSFFANPIVLKNPYNNVPFNKSTLYNIYFFIRENTYVFPELLHLFFITNFNISLFTDNYEHIIRESAIKYFVKNSAVATLHMYIFDMLDDYNRCYEIMFPYWRIVIDTDFPQNKLVDIMRPYLLLYLRSQYSLISTVRAFSKNRLKQKLDLLYTYNPSFGRKKIISENTYGLVPPQCVHVFDDKHPKFIKSHRNFLTTHREKIPLQRMNDYSAIPLNNDEYDDIEDEDYISAFDNIRILIRDENIE